MNIPTFNDLYSSILTDLKTKLQINYIIGKVVLNALAAVQAAKLKIIYTAIAFLYKNIFVDTADPESLGGSLERYGLVKLGRLPFPAVAGVYDINVSGTIGATIPVNTTFKSLDGSASPDNLFIVDVAFIFTGTTGVISIRALDLGPEARLEIGDQLQVTAPLANVDSFADIDSISVTPTAAESYADYRKATIDAYQLEAQGGARTDYRLWSQDAAGVRKVYPYVTPGEAGEINLYVEANVVDSIDGRGTPSSAILSDVEDVVEFDPDTTKPLNERGRRPLGVFKIHFLAVTPLPVDVEITDLSDPTLLTSIKTALGTFLFDIRPFIAGADSPADEQIGKIYLSDIFNVVRDVIGGQNSFTNITMTVNGSLETIYEFMNGDIPYIDDVTNI